MSSENATPATDQSSTETPTWTYPTRFCRICQEDVAPTVTLYPPGVPPRFQRPIVEYRNDDEYGRLVKPCKCTGSMRYIHELCLLRSRTENRREGSMWRCHTCGHQFNFSKLAVQKFLTSKYSSGLLTVVFMLVIMFFLGFIADPIINLYADPYETILGHNNVWEEVSMETPGRNVVSAWAQHFVKGLVSMGLVGFLKTMLLNPLNWLNIRHNLGMTSARTNNTGRDRAMNISWVAVLIGVISAFYFFYQWVQAIIQLSLRRVGNKIVDTQLPGDDEDLKPPPGWRSEHGSAAEPGDTETGDRSNTEASADTPFEKATDFLHNGETNQSRTELGSRSQQGTKEAETSCQDRTDSAASVLVGSWPSSTADIGRSSALDSTHDQGWSFAGI